MKNILTFSDVHLGIKSYSSFNEGGVSTSESECRKSVQYILERSKKPDVDIVIFAGDFFHTNHPTSSNIEWTINWLTDFNKINKPFYIIPGNHDVSTHSHSLAFVDDLELKNIHLIEKYDLNKNIKWEDWNIIFVPYEVITSSKDKESVILDNINQALNSAQDKSILVTHAQEKEARMGSEGFMLSRRVDVVDANNFDKRIILLMGHIHRHQIYNKTGKVTVTYPGCTTFMDAGDINTIKGYVLINSSGDIKFEPIPGIRTFFKYQLLNNENPVEFFKSFRMPQNQVVFLEYNYDAFNESELVSVLESKKNILGWAVRIKERKNRLSIERDGQVTEYMSPYEALKHKVELEIASGNIKPEIYDDLISIGNAMIEEVSIDGD